MTSTAKRRLPVLLAALAALLLALGTGPLEAHGGSAPDTPTGLTAAGFHGGIRLGHETANPHVVLSWDVPEGPEAPDDSGVTHYRVLRSDVDAHDEEQFTVLEWEAGPARLRYIDHSVENNRRYVYRLVAANVYGESEPSAPAVADTYMVAILPF